MNFVLQMPSGKVYQFTGRPANTEYFSDVVQDGLDVHTPVSKLDLKHNNSTTSMLNDLGEADVFDPAWATCREVSLSIQLLFNKMKFFRW